MVEVEYTPRDMVDIVEDIMQASIGGSTGSVAVEFEKDESLSSAKKDVKPKEDPLSYSDVPDTQPYVES